MRKLAPTAALLLAGCGSPDREPSPPVGPWPRLEAAAASVRSRLLRCEGMPSKPACNLDDSMGLAGYYRLGHTDPEIDAGVRASVTPEGRPYRSPKHARGEVQGDVAGSKSFSRDHVLSLAFWTLGARDPGPLSRVVSYARSHDWKVCPDPQCLLTPGLLDIVGDVLASVGAPKPEGTRWDNGVIEHAARIEAETLQGYALVLLVDKAYLKALTGNLTKAWVDISGRSVARNQQNIYFRFVSEFAHGGSADAYDRIASEVSDALEQWGGPGSCNRFSHQCADSVGWELVSLADWMGDEHGGKRGDVALVGRWWRHLRGLSRPSNFELD